MYRPVPINGYRDVLNRLNGIRKLFAKATGIGFDGFYEFEKLTMDLAAAAQEQELEWQRPFGNYVPTNYKPDSEPQP